MNLALKEKLRIHWIAEAITPYNDFLFSSLAKEDDVDLLVHYRLHTAEMYLWNLPEKKSYKFRVFKNILGIDWSILSLPFREKRAFFVVTGIKGLTKSLLIILLSTLGRKYAYWSDTPPKDYFDTMRGWLFRRPMFWFVFRRAEKIYTTGIPGHRFFVEHGAPESMVENLPFFWDLNPGEITKEERKDAEEYFAHYIQRGDFVIIMSGKLVHNKRYDVAVSAAAEVLKRTQRKNIKFLIAGEGPERKALEPMIQKYGLVSNFFLLGWLDGTRLDYFHEIGNVFLHTPLVDPFPTVVLKAMVWGKAIVGFDGSGSIEDRVRDGVNGFKIKNGNIEHLIDRLVYLVDHKDVCAKMGKEARITAEQWPVSRGIAMIKRTVRSAFE